MSSVTTKVPTFSRKSKEARDYWIKKLLGKAGTTNLKTDFERPSSYASERESVDIAVPEGLAAKLARLTGNSPFLNYTAMLAALKICLHKYTGSASIVVGSPTRLKDETTDQPPNALAIANDIDSRMTFRQLLVSVRDTLTEGYARQSYPFERVVKDLGVKQTTNRCPLFDVTLSLENIHGELPEVSNDITISFRMWPDGITGSIQYRSELFRRETIDRFSSHLFTALDNALENIDWKISDLSILTPAEQQRFIKDLNDTATDYPQDQAIQQLFEAAVEKHPEAVAIAYEGGNLTYTEVNAHANRLAHYLRSIGVGTETLVGILLERSPQTLIAMLGVLKAGGAFVPLDTSYPRERLAFMVEDAQFKFLVTRQGLVSLLPDSDATLICLDTDRDQIASHPETNPAHDTIAPQSLAYAMYTSGSTGRPKGAMISQQALINYSVEIARQLDLQPTDRILQFASFSFDVMIEELFPTWLAGASIVMRDEMQMASYANLLGIIEEAGVTALELPTAYWREWVYELTRTGAKPPAHLRFVMIGGERAPAAQLATWQKFNIPLLNMYGLTETTVTSTTYKLDSNQPDTAFPIGRPIANTQMYVLDADMQPVPEGVSGEIYIGGAGVGRGYLNRPDLTADKFIPNPFGIETGTRLYKTGDHARFLADGNIEFIGRADHQIKMRGYRIELGEIEAALKKFPAVQDAVVTVRDENERQRQTTATDSEETLIARLATLGDEQAAQLFAEIESLSDDHTAAILAQEGQLNTQRSQTKIRRYKQFDVSVTLKDDNFISPPRESQRSWLLRRALNEFADDLVALDEASKRMVSGSARVHLQEEWKGSGAKYDDTQLIIQGQQVMQDWEHPLMKAMAEIVTESHGDILELGFGMAISATYIQQFGCRSYTVIEANEGVVEHFKKWKEQFPGRDINIIHSRWHDAVDKLEAESFDGIFFDTVPTDEEEYMREVIDNVVMAEDIFPAASRLLRKGGIFTWYTNEIDSFSRRHQRLALKYFSSVAVSVVKGLAPPEDCHYWWSDSMVAVKAVK
ncbi:MAG TPA: amino acid adenylation domain-containing protein [Pyrinomonadaceae bacterium]